MFLRNPHKTFPEVSSANSGAGIGCVAGILAALVVLMQAGPGAVLPPDWAFWMLGLGALAGVIAGGIIGAAIDYRYAGSNRAQPARQAVPVTHRR